MDSTSNDTARVELDGAQIVRTIQTSHGKLIAALAQHDAIEVSLAGTSEFDLSLMQLLIAARRSAAKAGKTLCLTSPADGALKDALARAGFLAGDAEDRASDTALWTNGTGAR
ncbi:STAS domain-containing protein [Rhodovulum sp. PH10]|uniref:STAS domain-containing protein n=1 Tax=Rhodovulum sp. PH10 TaxID=1187851 RepID=UPI0002E1F546|nr:STAS domain-containing protein [Rhodovulum sp. PH10]